jgi:hypothetical protein
MVGEVPIFGSGSVLNIAVATPQAPADNCAGIGVGTTALAISLRALALWGQDTEVDLYCGGVDFSHLLIRCVFVLGTGAKLDGALAVIALLHRETAEAVAVFAAFEVVPGDVTMMPMAHLVFLSSRFAGTYVFMPFSLRQRRCESAAAGRLWRGRPR